MPQAIASIIARPNGSGQSIGNSSARASPRNSVFCRLVDLADELDARSAQQRLDRVAEIGLVDLVDLGGDLAAAVPRRARSRSRGPAASPARCARGRRDSRRAAVGRLVQLQRKPVVDRWPRNWRAAAAAAGRSRSRPAACRRTRHRAVCRSGRSCRAVQRGQVRAAIGRNSGNWNGSIWKCRMSNSSARRRTWSSISM